VFVAFSHDEVSPSVGTESVQWGRINRPLCD